MTPEPEPRAAHDTPTTAAEWQAEAEQRLATARAKGDRVAEASALNDLVALQVRRGAFSEAVGWLQQAVEVVRSLGDRGQEEDVLGHLGTMALAQCDAQRAIHYFSYQLGSAQQAGDRPSTRLALARLAVASALAGQPAQALGWLEQALALARAVDDSGQEAELRWLGATFWAEQGDRATAWAWAEAAVDQMTQLGRPEVGIYAEHLERFRKGPPPVRAQDAKATHQPAMGPTPGEAGMLRQAMQAARAACDLLGSGARTVTSSVRAERLQACAGCARHTGLRCRACGCFTAVKSWLPHETCPEGRWPRS